MSVDRGPPPKVHRLLPEGFPRPRRAAMPVLAGVGLLALWAVVARDGGLGWVEAVGALVGGALVVGLVGPAVALARLRVEAASSPPDAVRGAPVRIVVTVSGAAEVRPVAPPGPAKPAGRTGQVTLEVVPDRRGLLEDVTVALATAAPFGILWWTRAVVVPLTRPVAVAPRVGSPDHATVVGHGARPRTGTEDRARGGRPAVTVRAAGAEPRGVRPYTHGDRRHLVHWPVTAHTGTLMVRETESRHETWAVVDGSLPDDVLAAEVHAERVMGTVARLLAEGAAVELRTVEPGGEVTGRVASAAEAGRRLAVAVPLPVYLPRSGPRRRPGRRRLPSAHELPRERATQASRPAEAPR